MFPLLGVQPALGRFFGPADDTPPAGRRVVVLSHGLWMRRFGGDPSVLGRALTITGQPFTVIGVAPRGFSGAELRRVDVWTPVSSVSHPRSDWTTTWNAKWLHTIGRLRPEISPETAAAEATAVYRSAYANRPSPAGATFRDDAVVVDLRPLRYTSTGAEPMEAVVGRWLAGVAAVVLIVACANVTNMLLARGVRRRREIAVRAALGISRGRLIRWLAAEILVLTAAGAAAGLQMAFWVGRFMRSVLLPEVAWTGMPLDLRVLAFTAAATMAAALVVGFAPVGQAMRQRLTDSLRDGAPQAGRARARLRLALGTAQAALSIVLLVGAGLFVQSFVRVLSLDLGIDADRVLAVSPRWPDLTAIPTELRAAERARRRETTDRILAHVRGRAGVEGAAAAIGVPFDSVFGLGISVPGLDKVPELPGGGPYASAVGPGYFRTVGTDIVAGRAFQEGEGASTERVAIVSTTTAQALWPNESPLDRCLVVADRPCARVVGVAEDARRFELREEPALQFYVPIGQQVAISGTTLLVRPSADHPIEPMALRRELFDLDPTLASIDVLPLQERIDPQVRPWRLGATLFGVFGALAFVMASFGLYSVIAYTTAQRTHELGVRLALGAQTAHVLRLVIGGALAIAAIGVGAGVLIALAAGPTIEPLLFDTSPRSPVVFVVVAAVLLITALLAGAIPARRATRIDPAMTLRT